MRALHVHLRRGALVLLAAGAVSVPAAQADAPWSAPAPIAGSERAPMAGLDLDPSGAGLAWWNAAVPGTNGAALAGGGAAAGRLLTSDLQFAPPDGEVAAYGAGRLLAVGALRREDDQRVAGAAFGTSDGTFTSPQRLGGPLTDVTIAADAGREGDLAAAYVDDDGVHLHVGREGRLGKARRLASAGEDVSVAVGDRGTVVVAWRQNGSVRARMRTDDGDLTATEVLASTDDEVDIATAVRVGGAALVGWTEEHVSENVARSEAVQHVAYAPRPGAFGDARELERFDDRPLGAEMYVRGRGLDVGFTGRGDAIVAWTGMEDGVHVVRAAAVGPDGPEPAQRLSAPGEWSELAALATGENGEALAVWSTGSAREAHSSLRAATRAPWASAFDGAEHIAGPDGVADEAARTPGSHVADAAFDDTTNRPGVVWVRGYGPADGLALATRAR